MSTNPKKRKPSPRAKRRTLTPAEWKQLNAAIAREVDRLLNPDAGASTVKVLQSAESAALEDVPPATPTPPDPLARTWTLQDHPGLVEALNKFQGFGSRIIGEAIEELQKLHDRKASIEREAAKTEDLGRAFWDAVDSFEGPARVRKINAALEVLGSTKRLVGDGQVVDLKPAK